MSGPITPDRKPCPWCGNLVVIIDGKYPRHKVPASGGKKYSQWCKASGHEAATLEKMVSAVRRAKSLWEDLP